MLALLLLQCNQVVSTQALISELWTADPPSAALSTVRTHVYHLRQLLAEADPDSPPPIVTRPSGYLLRLREDQLDVSRFSRLVAQVRVLLAENRVDEARGRLDQALALWRSDEPLADVEPGLLIAGHLRRLSELRSQALELHIEINLRLGRHRELVAELQDLVAAHPFNEWYHARLIDALHRSGRRSDALSALTDLRTLLDRELGLEPSQEIWQLQQEILTGQDHHGPAQLRRDTRLHRRRGGSLASAPVGR
ncbi:AfsR/SARP family transcriptional regulator [Kitasatospora sp. SUK 42]|nr:AfsR/SARP family transcriptional regulator [Kitasatospora sp. SUK 42]